MHQIMADLIRAESYKLNGLPTLGSWHTSTTKKGYGPEFQLGLLDENIPIIPWFILPEPGQKINMDYYFPLLEKAARYHLPIAFVCTQLERTISDRANLKRPDGTMEKRVSPFGPLRHWREMGRKWNEQLGQFKKWYRDPPLVLLVSNNEHPKIRWTDTNYVDFIKNYLGPNLQYIEPNEEEKRRAISEGYREVYGAMLNEINCFPIKKIGYNAYVPSFIGRWSEWAKYSLHSQNDLTPWTVWDGHSTSLYMSNGCTDCNAWSIQSESMNLFELFGLTNGWNEVSYWHEPNQFTTNGQTYTPERYEGSTQWSFWMCKPRSIREFRPHTEDLKNESYFRALTQIVRRVYDNKILQDYWFNSYPLRAERPHFYTHQSILRPDRWFALETNLTPNGKWKHHTELPVFVLGMKHNLKDEILIYAHAPIGDKTCEVNVPNVGNITLDVPLSGKFWTYGDKLNVV